MSAHSAQTDSGTIPARISRPNTLQPRQWPTIDSSPAAGRNAISTPSAVEIRSGEATMLFVADITNNPLIFARNPSWQAVFDLDPEQAVATRRKLLDRAAAEQLRLFYFHAPFPAMGTVVKSGDGYEYLPALWT